jgi:hypothetical protein
LGHHGSPPLIIMLIGRRAFSRAELR